MRLAHIRPEMYRLNLYRITGLPVDAGPRAIRRCKRSLVLEPDTLVVSAEDLDKAFDAYDRHPGIRLIDELFWYWAGTTVAHDPELVRLHDDAVDAHRSALDTELDRTAAAMDDPDLERLAADWHRAAEAWARLLTGEDLWTHLERRRTEIDDKRLGPDFVAELRSQLPRLFLHVIAVLALVDAERGHDAERHRRTMTAFAEAAQVDRDAVQEELRAVTEPLRTGVHVAARNAVARADESAAGALDTGWALHERIEPELGVLRRVHGADSVAVLRSCDAGADALRKCAFTYGQHVVDRAVPTQDDVRALQKARPLLQAAGTIGGTETTRRAVDGTVESLEEIARGWNHELERPRPARRPKPHTTTPRSRPTPPPPAPDDRPPLPGPPPRPSAPPPPVVTPENFAVLVGRRVVADALVVLEGLAGRTLTDEQWAVVVDAAADLEDQVREHPRRLLRLRVALAGLASGSDSSTGPAGVRDVDTRAPENDLVAQMAPALRDTAREMAEHIRSRACAPALVLFDELADRVRTDDDRAGLRQAVEGLWPLVDFHPPRRDRYLAIERRLEPATE